MRYFFFTSLLSSLLTLASCGGDDSAPADASGDTSTTIDSSTDGATDAATDAIVDSSTADAPDCTGAMEGGACTAEGAYCGGPCTDACSFCNLLQCSGGMWARVEVSPAPCFSCGPDTRCQSDVQYCVDTVPGVPGGSESYECVDPPAACADDLSCDCLSTAGVDGRCSEGDAGEVTVTIDAA